MRPSALGGKPGDEPGLISSDQAQAILEHETKKSETRLQRKNLDVWLATNRGLIYTKALSLDSN
jgi:hypothetical protein